MKTKLALLFLIAMIFFGVVASLLVFWNKRCGYSQSEEVSKFPFKEKWSASLSEGITDLSASEDGNIFARTPSSLYYLEGQSGRILWTFPIAKQVQSSSVLSQGELAYFTDYEGIWAVNLKNGHTAWHQSLIDENSWITDVSAKVVLVNRPSNDISAYDALSGELLWRTPVGRGRIQAFVDSNTVYIPDYGINAIEAMSGNPMWTQGTDTIGSSAYAEGIIYYLRWMPKTENVAYIVAFDVRNQTELWSNKVTASGFPSFKVSDSNISVTDSESLFVFDKLDGRLIWKTGVSAPTNPTLVDKTILVLEAFSGVIRAFQVQNGKELGSLSISNCRLYYTDQQLMLSSNGMLFFAVGNTVFAYEQ